MITIELLHVLGDRKQPMCLWRAGGFFPKLNDFHILSWVIFLTTDTKQNGTGMSWIQKSTIVWLFSRTGQSAVNCWANTENWMKWKTTRKAYSPTETEERRRTTTTLVSTFNAAFILNPSSVLVSCYQIKTVNVETVVVVRVRSSFSIA